MSESASAQKKKKTDQAPEKGMGVSLVRIFGRLPQGSQNFLPSDDHTPPTPETKERRKTGR